MCTPAAADGLLFAVWVWSGVVMCTHGHGSAAIALRLPCTCYSWLVIVQHSNRYQAPCCTEEAACGVPASTLHAGMAGETSGEHRALTAVHAG